MKNHKIKQNVLFVLAVVFLVLVSSCNATMPVMQLNHYPENLGDTYRNKGKIKVLKFKDDRPAEEYGEEYINATNFDKVIWTRNTDPLMDEYLKTVIEDEIRECGLFTLSSNTDYVLSGTIKSIKNVHKPSPVKIVSVVLLTTSAILIPTVGVGLGLVPLGIIVVAVATSKDKLESIVSYDILLTKHGVKVWQDEIHITVNQKYPTGFKGNEKIIAESSEIIDQVITQSVREMLQKINKEVK